MHIDDPQTDSDAETDTESLSLVRRSAASTSHNISPRRPKHMFDRFIPNRIGVNLPVAYSLAQSDDSGTTVPPIGSEDWPYATRRVDFQKLDRANRTFSTVLKAELFANDVPSAVPDSVVPLTSPVKTAARASTARSAHRRSRRSRNANNNDTTNNNNTTTNTTGTSSDTVSSANAANSNNNTNTSTNLLMQNMRHIRRHERDLNRNRMARASASSLRSNASEQSASTSTSLSAARAAREGGGALASMRSVPDLIRESDMPSRSPNLAAAAATFAGSPTSRESTRSSRFSEYSRTSTSAVSAPSTPKKNLFHYNGGTVSPFGGLSPHKAKTFGGRTRFYDRIDPMVPNSEIYSTSPMRLDSQRLLLTPEKKPRNISLLPFKVLDAPELADDFYLNLVDWGQQDVLAVGLAKAVYMWNAATGTVSNLCCFTEATVASLNWSPSGNQIAVGTNDGSVLIFDVAKGEGSLLCELRGHGLRVASLSWNSPNVISSGSQDRLILNRDIRQGSSWVSKFRKHTQEVCGLRWNSSGDTASSSSSADNLLASGGNDNKLLVWDGRNATEPLYEFTDFDAAVKAIAWSPHQRGLLAAGGGTADKRIRFWNANTGAHLQDIDTGSQVCNLAWSKTSREIVSTHGFSHNQITIWDYPSMDQVATLTGHTYRVLYLAMNPDGTTIVTGAGDETLRFWNAFDKTNQERAKPSLLDVFQQLR